MIVKNVFLCAFAVLSLTACKPTEEKAMQLGQKEIAQGLKDPDSAKFKLVRFNRDKTQKVPDSLSGYVCGRVAGKNSFGAYVGYQPFYIHLALTPKGTFSSGVTYTVGDKAIYLDGRTEEWIDVDGNTYVNRCGITPTE